MLSSSVVFTFDDMITSLKKAIGSFPDKRTGKNTQYQMIDAAAGAFSVFFTQCPSFLSSQKLMQQRYGLSNAKTLFGMRDIPSDNHIRNLLDTVPASSLDAVFIDCFAALQKSGDLNAYRIPLGTNSNDLLVALDGTQYFSSANLHCKKCTKKIKDGQIQYSHTMVTPTIVAPGKNKIISLSPECITPQDGDSKQDCELKASKRWLKRSAPHYGFGGITVLGDDLYSHEPFCLGLLRSHMNFILVCKPESHKTIYEWVKGITTVYVEDRFDGKTHQIYTYNYVEGVPLRDGEDSLLVNFIEITVTDRKSGRKLYHNAFITTHPLTEKTLPTIVDCGRARWKIENENNNVLKRQGYNLEHNFGHGKKQLASLLAVMNVLAFLFHTMLEYMDKKYQLLRQVIGARKTFFNDMRALLKHVCCRSFESLMDFMIQGLKQQHDLKTLRFPV